MIAMMRTSSSTWKRPRAQKSACFTFYLIPVFSGGGLRLYLSILWEGGRSALIRYGSGFGDAVANQITHSQYYRMEKPTVVEQFSPKTSLLSTAIKNYSSGYVAKLFQFSVYTILYVRMSGGKVHRMISVVLS